MTRTRKWSHCCVAGLTLILLVGCRSEKVETRTAAPTTSGVAPTATTSAATTASAAPAAATTISACTPAPGRLCPIDEGAESSSFAAFRQQMLEAVERKDEAALLAMIDPRIRTTFGEDGGIDAFKAAWKTSSADSPLWRELEWILRNGGGFQEGSEQRSFWAPYVYARWPDTYDAFEHVAAIGADVKIRTAPSSEAAEVASVDRAILELIDAPQEPDTPWRQVKTLDGKSGWVLSSEVRSPIGYRAGFSEQDGAWKMTALVAGD